MRNSGLIIFLLALVLGSPVGALANEKARLFEQISDLNTGNPLTNLRFERAEKVLQRDVLDRKNRVVAQIDNILLNDEGYVKTISMEFKGFTRGQKIPLDYEAYNIRGVTSVFILGLYDQKQLEDLYPSMLSDIQSAAGVEQGGLVSLKDLPGSSVKNQKGDTLGIVKDVLFDNSGRTARALYIEISHGQDRGKKVALPFGAADYTAVSTSKTIIVSDDLKDAVTDFAKSYKK